MYRVIAPPIDEKLVEKVGEKVLKVWYLIPCFATAGLETGIEALPGCWDEVMNPKRFEKTTAWGYVQMSLIDLEIFGGRVAGSIT